MDNAETSEPRNESELPETQVDTESIGDLIEPRDIEKDENWAKLISINPNLTTKDLINDSYKFGRDTASCDMVYTDKSILSLISRIHFSILRRDSSDYGVSLVYLEDLSLHGTFVNGKLIGKKQKVLLNTADEISVVFPWIKVYLFVAKSYDQNPWLPTALCDSYVVLKHLGRGGYGDVKLVMNKITCRHHALKKLSNDIGHNKIFNEINILKRLNHPCIVKFEEVVEGPDSVCIFLEYMPDGNLLKKIHNDVKIKEDEAKMIFYQLTLAVDYLHDEGITHRDLKPENILLSYTSLSLNSSKAILLVKVADFGLSKITSSKTNLQTACGTILYAAPEVLFAQSWGPYNKKVDIWSLGVMLYACLKGYSPFNDEELRKPIDPKTWCLRYRIKDYYGLSSNATDLIKKMIKIPAGLRIDTKSIFKHSWMLDHSTLKINAILGLPKRPTPKDDLDIFCDWKRPKIA